MQNIIADKHLRDLFTSTKHVFDQAIERGKVELDPPPDDDEMVRVDIKFLAGIYALVFNYILESGKGVWDDEKGRLVWTDTYNK